MPNRREILAGLTASLPLAALMRPARAQSTASRVTAYAFSFKTLDGGDLNLASYAGKPVLVVNTASHCAFTPQYAGLQDLYREFGAAGLMVIGVPSNDFGGQEPGGAKEIRSTAQDHYHVNFPITAKTVVKGPQAHPFYRWAAAERPKDVPAWNFHKYLLGRDGYIAEAFSSTVDPTDARIKAAINRVVISS